MDNYCKLDVEALISAVRGRDDAAFAELVNRYSPLMNNVISSFRDVSLSFDDMFAEATVALHVAALRFDLSQDQVTFGLYARICIQHRLVDHLRREEPSPRIVELDVDGVESEESMAEELAAREGLESLLHSARKTLSDYEYKVLILHVQGFKTAAIAARLDKTAKSVDNAKSRIFRRLRELLGSSVEF